MSEHFSFKFLWKNLLVCNSKTYRNKFKRLKGFRHKTTLARLVSIIIIIIAVVVIAIFLLASLSHQRQLMVFHWSLNESKSPRVSCILLSILADLNIAVVLMVSGRPSIYNASSPLWGIVPSALITIGITVTFNFHSFPVLWQGLRGSLNKFPDFFRMGTFIDSTHIKL